MVSMLFCQMAQAKSLREIDSGLRSCEGKLQHLGMAKAPSRSTLSYANAKRPAELFEKVFYNVLGTASSHAPGKQFKFKSKLLAINGDGSFYLLACHEAGERLAHLASQTRKTK